MKIAWWFPIVMFVITRGYSWMWTPQVSKQVHLPMVARTRPCCRDDLAFCCCGSGICTGMVAGCSWSLHVCVYIYTVYIYTYIHLFIDDVQDMIQYMIPGIPIDTSITMITGRTSRCKLRFIFPGLHVWKYHKSQPTFGPVLRGPKPLLVAGSSALAQKSCVCVWTCTQPIDTKLFKKFVRYKFMRI